MGRRQLPKIDGELDLSGHLVNPDQLPTPFDPTATFGRCAPLEIEIGSGKGLFLSTAATAHPDRDYFGVEIMGKYARFIAARLAKQALPNTRILHGDGVKFLQTVPDDSVAAVHVYFPDPWWKKRHRKRRVMNESLLAAVDRILIPDGRLHFWTDVKEYFESTLELMQSASKLIGPIDVVAEPALHDMDYRTHFERRVRVNALPVYRAEYFKRPWRVEVTVTPQGVET
jgi:tRNA (guanine-N7-)-methyltransferase